MVVVNETGFGKEEDHLANSSGMKFGIPLDEFSQMKVADWAAGKPQELDMPPPTETSANLPPPR